jgi:predicted nucleic-acid-binding protein
VNITVDTNVLVRSVMRDDLKQARAADRILRQAKVIAVTVPVLCEFVWVLRGVYGLGTADIASSVRALLDAANLVTDRAVVETGLALFEAGGDFADGVIAHEGLRLEGEVFVSFDHKAVTLLSDIGFSATLLK